MALVSIAACGGALGGVAAPGRRHHRVVGVAETGIPTLPNASQQVGVIRHGVKDRGEADRIGSGVHASFDGVGVLLSAHAQRQASHRRRRITADRADPARDADAVAIVKVVVATASPRLGGALASGGAARAGVRRQAVAAATAVVARCRRQIPQRKRPARHRPDCGA